MKVSPRAGRAGHGHLTTDAAEIAREIVRAVEGAGILAELIDEFYGLDERNEPTAASSSTSELLLYLLASYLAIMLRLAGVSAGHTPKRGSGVCKVPKKYQDQVSSK